MKISTKVILGFALLLVLILTGVVVEYRQVTWAKNDLEQFEKSTLQESTIANDLMRIGTLFEISLMRKADDSPHEFGNDLLAEFSRVIARARIATEAGADIARSQGALARVADEQAELDFMKRIESEFAAMSVAWQAQMDLTHSGDQRIQIQRQVLAHWQKKLRPLLRQYQESSFNELLDQNRANLIRTETAFASLLGIGLLALLTTVLGSFWIVRAVMKPLGEAVEVVEDIAAGNHRRRLRVAGNGEFTLLAQSFNHMLDRQDELGRARDELRALADLRLGELDDFFSLSMDVLGIASSLGFFQRVNPAFVTLLGFSEEELLKRPFLEFVHPDDRDVTKAEVAKLMRGEPTCNFENRYRCRDGTWKWIAWHVNPRPQTGLLYAVGRDVTEKKSIDNRLHESQVALCELNARLEHMVAERTSGLHESEERFRVLVEGVNDYAIFLLNVDGRIVSWNAGAERIKGYKAEEVIGQHIAKFYCEGDVVKGKPMYALEMAKSRGRFEEAGWRVCKDGHRFWANVVINAIRSKDGALLGFAKITRDITEQKRTGEELQRQQELLRSLMENLAEGVVACDATGKLTFFNKVAREWHGTDILTVPTEKWADSFDIYATDGKTHLAMEDIPLVRAATGEHVRDVEMVIARKDSPPRWVTASGDPLLDVAGNMIGAVVVMRDITERRNAERSNLRTQRLESLGTLSGGIAHDLNNALAPILMGMELLKMRYPDASSIISGMEKSAQRGAGMVRQLLTFAKGVDGERVTMQPRHFVGEIQSIIEHSFPKNIECRVVVHEDVRPVLGDATQIHQVLLNLCVNARDAMPDGGTLTLEAGNRCVGSDGAGGSPEIRPGDYVYIRISDTGTGIPPAIIEHIFDPFFTTKPADKGTGLGLSTVMGIVRNHGGGLQVSSVLNEGTSFVVLLPAAKGEAVASRPPMDEKLDFNGGNRLILIVDDEPAVREISRTVLQALEFQVITADDGEQGLKQVEALGKGIALIIGDRHMPKMDGMVFAKKARELLPDVPMMVSSGRMEKADVAALADLGIHTVLNKPFTQKDLIKALQAVLAPV
ncbi:MAG: PAS domain S-box protein [Opitutaceae bacterium]|jgi:PAS domain S-box-containing protein